MSAGEFLTDAQIESEHGYKPGTRLGCSGYTDEPADQLATRVEHLNALTTLITISGPDQDGFFNCNPFIQESVLRLVSSLAEEVHELHHRIECERFVAKMKACRNGGRA